MMQFIIQWLKTFTILKFLLGHGHFSFLYYCTLLNTGEVDDSKVSNLLEVTLPLDVASIVLPSEGKRLDEEELYMEYLDIHEGSGYLTAMDGELRYFCLNIKCCRLPVNKDNCINCPTRIFIYFFN
jgi:hypothetical protein